MTKKSSIPAAVEKALRHVQTVHPEVVSVTFLQEDADCGGIWRYSDRDGNSPAFGAGIDVSLLEIALDAAWEDQTFPAIYELAGTI